MTYNSISFIADLDFPSSLILLKLNILSLLPSFQYHLKITRQLYVQYIRTVYTVYTVCTYIRIYVYKKSVCFLFGYYRYDGEITDDAELKDATHFISSASPQVNIIAS